MSRNVTAPALGIAPRSAQLGDDARTAGTLTPECFRRVRAVLVLKGLTFAALADSCDVTPYHLRLALSGLRAMSEILAVCVRRELGDEGWFYVLGQRAKPA